MSICRRAVLVPRAEGCRLEGRVSRLLGPEREGRGELRVVGRTGTIDDMTRLWFGMIDCFCVSHDR